jgi:hypothetical protein
VASQDGFIALSESVVKDIEKVEQKIINHKSQIINVICDNLGCGPHIVPPR